MAALNIALSIYMLATNCGPSIANNEEYEVLTWDTLLVVFKLFFVAGRAASMPVFRPVFEQYFPYWQQNNVFVQFIFQQACKILDPTLNTEIFFQLARDPYSQGVSPNGRHIYLNPQFYEDVDPPLLRKMQAGVDWRELIGRELEMADKLLLSALLGHLFVRPFTYLLPPNYFARSRLSDADFGALCGFSDGTFNRNEAMPIAGMKLCQWAAIDRRLQQATLSNTQNFVWFAIHVMAILCGFDIVNGRLVPSNLVNTNPNVRALKDQLDQLVRDVMEC